jgi:S1-C subfamily serine protease
MSSATTDSPAGRRSVKQRRRARRALITTAIAAFVSVGAGVGAADGIVSEPAVSSAGVQAAGRVEASLVRIRITSEYRARSADGVVIRSDGYVLVGADLLAGMGKNLNVMVTMRDGQHAVADLVGVDETTGLAVLKTAAADLVAASFASTDTLTAEQAAHATRAGIVLLDARGQIIGLARSSATSGPIAANQSVRAAVEIIAANHPAARTF